MEFERAAIGDLKAHANRKVALEHIQRQINAFRTDMEAIQAVSYNQTVTVTGGNTAESNAIAGISKIETLERRFKAIKLMVDVVDDVLIKLDEEQRLALEYFYINPTPHAQYILSRTVNCSHRTAYRIKDAALHQFIEKMYGV